jgi:hypothetical protein
VNYSTFLSALHEIHKHTFPASSVVPMDHLKQQDVEKLQGLLNNIR